MKLHRRAGANLSHPEFSPFSFVFCLLYLLSRNVFCFRYCYWLQLFSSLCRVSVLSFPRAISSLFHSFLPPSPPVYTSHFILQTSTQIYFNPQTRYTKSHFTSAAAVAGACHCYEVFKFYFNVCTEH